MPLSYRQPYLVTSYWSSLHPMGLRLSDMSSEGFLMGDGESLRNCLGSAPQDELAFISVMALGSAAPTAVPPRHAECI